MALAWRLSDARNVLEDEPSEGSGPNDALEALWFEHVDMAQARAEVGVMDLAARDMMERLRRQSVLQREDAAYAAACAWHHTGLQTEHGDPDRWHFERVIWTLRYFEAQHADELAGLAAEDAGARDAFARALFEGMKAVRTRVLAGSPPVGDAACELVSSPAGSILRWDAAFADYLSTLGKGGKEIAGDVRGQARGRAAAWTGEAPVLLPPLSGDLWLLWRYDVLPEVSDPLEERHKQPRWVIRLARALWLDTIRPAFAAEYHNAATWKAPSMLAGLARHVAQPPRTEAELTDNGALGWRSAGVHAGALESLSRLTRAEGRAVLRRLPHLARLAAIAAGKVVTVWAEGEHRVTAQTLAGSSTLVRVYAPRSIDSALRAWLDLGHKDARPMDALKVLSALAVNWTLTDGSLCGPLVFDVLDGDDAGSGGRGFMVSAALHPAVAARMKGAILVPCLIDSPPTWNSAAAALCDALDHAMMMQLADHCYDADPDHGVCLDVDAMLSATGGDDYRKRPKVRAEAMARLGLDGGVGLWTGAGGRDPRWIVRDGRFMPADPGAQALLREGWALRKQATADGKAGGAAGKGTKRPRTKQGRWTRKKEK